MTREQLEKDLPKETIEQCSKGYASRIPAPKDETEFKQKLAEAYLAGTELIIDWYLEHR